MKKIIIILLLLVASCATNPQEIKPGDEFPGQEQLSPNPEGLLTDANAHCMSTVEGGLMAGRGTRAVKYKKALEMMG